MSFSHTVTKTVQGPGGFLGPASAQSYTASAHAGFTEAVADSQTDKQINIAFTYADIVSFYLLSDQDVTIETNSGSAADDTLTVLANVPYEWQSDSPHDNPFTADVTAFFVTNASGAQANISCEVIYDSTP